MSHFIMSLVPDPDNPLHQDGRFPPLIGRHKQKSAPNDYFHWLVANMQREVTRQLDAIRTLESTNDPFRHAYVPPITLDPGPPLSPRQVARDDSRRPSMARPPVPAHVAMSPRRYGSVGTANASPRHRPPVVVQQPVPHPLSSVSSPPGPNLARRHTSADIREHGWPTSGTSHLAPNAGAGPWSYSPHKSQNPNSSEQHVRDVLAQYEMGRPRHQPDISRHSTPPTTSSDPPPFFSNDSLLSVSGPKFHRVTDHSLPATRRSSMASNVHSLLNPTVTAERGDEDEGPLGEDRKRKRLQ